MPKTKAPVKAESSIIRELRIKLESSPDDPVLLNNLAVRYTLENQFDRALAASLRSVSINGNIASTRINLAVIYDRLGHFDQARSQAAIAARLAPKALNVRNYVCELDLVRGRNTEAVGCYRQLMNEFPPQRDLRLKFAVALMMSGNLSDARKLMDALQKEYPNDAMVL
ncbi:MAG: tetratricopeptide repeat protein, partial [Acidobacteria bacterium]|nr:tetratricopeptide repeat protein [Acidobacteriota bacterium]